MPLSKYMAFFQKLWYKIKRLKLHYKITKGFPKPIPIILVPYMKGNKLYVVQNSLAGFNRDYSIVTLLVSTDSVIGVIIFEIVIIHELSFVGKNIIDLIFISHSTCEKRTKKCHWFIFIIRLK